MSHTSQATRLDLTILVPIFDRHVFMSRCLRNLEALSGLAYFVFVDSGENPYDPREINKYLSIGSFEFLYFGVDRSTNDNHKKLLRAISRCNTKYVLRIDNDDIIDPRNVARIVKFLDENSDYVAARGHISGFELHHPLPYGRVTLLHAAYHKDDALKDLSSENLGTRFIAAFTDGGVNEYYSVWKRENLTNLYRLLGELTFEWGHPYPEMIFQTAALTQGPIAHLENHCHLHRQGRTSLRIHKALRLFEENKAATDARNSEMTIKDLIEPTITSEDAKSLFWDWYRRREAHENRKFPRIRNQLTEKRFDVNSSNGCVENVRGEFLEHNKNLLAEHRKTHLDQEGLSYLVSIVS